MNQDIVNLVLLQKLDNEITRVKRVAQDGPKRLAEVDLEMTQAREKVDQSLALEKDYLKRRRELEIEIADTEEKLKQNQTRQLRVKTNEEYRAILKENDYLKKSNSAREDEILELMEKLESLSEENKTLKKWLEEQTSHIGRRKEEIEQAIATSLKELERLEVERKEIVGNISVRPLAMYERMFTALHGRAVVAIINGVCQECHLQIPPQQFNDLQRNESLMTCPYCNRIIFWQEHEDFMTR